MTSFLVSDWKGQEGIACLIDRFRHEGSLDAEINLIACAALIT
jgi:hypothetical protein